MKDASRYWQLVCLTSQGTARWVEQPAAKAEFQQHLVLDLGEDPHDRAVQTHLMQMWQAADEASTWAELCLRCFISHQIYWTCWQWVNRFGETAGVTLAVLLPCVLTDEGRPFDGSAQKPLSHTILQTFDPTRAGLAAWTQRLTQHHSELNQTLLEHGVYHVSDWAILNDTTPEQVASILSEFHSRSAAEVASAQQLLRRYHQVYRQARLRQRQAGSRSRCAVPTTAQLQQMDPTVSPHEVQTRLQRLADELRAYRIWVRSGWLDSTRSFDDPEVREQPAPARSEADQEQDQCLQRYRALFLATLDQAIAQVLTQRQNDPPHPLKALQAFHCQGCSLRQIAPLLGLTTQVQVTRRLQLRRLRADIRHHWIQALQTQVRELAATYAQPQRLHQLEQQLDTLLDEAVDAVIDEAEREAQQPSRQQPRSLLAVRLCHHLAIWLKDSSV